MPKGNPLLPRDFLYCLSLQAGVVGCSVPGFTLMLITTLVNIYSANGEKASIQAVQFILLFLYLLVMYCGFFLAFLAGFWEIYKFIKYGVFLISFGLTLYILYSILSIIPTYSTMINVCPGMRCPDHHWLHIDRWRRFVLRNKFSKQLKEGPDQDVLKPSISNLVVNSRLHSPQKLMNDVGLAVYKQTSSHFGWHNYSPKPWNGIVLGLEGNWSQNRIDVNIIDSTTVGNVRKFSWKHLIATVKSETFRKTSDSPNNKNVYYFVHNNTVKGEKQKTIYMAISVFYMLLYIGMLFIRLLRNFCWQNVCVYTHTHSTRS